MIYGRKLILNGALAAPPVQAPSQRYSDSWT